MVGLAIAVVSSRAPTYTASASFLLHRNGTEALQPENPLSAREVQVEIGVLGADSVANQAALPVGVGEVQPVSADIANDSDVIVLSVQSADPEQAACADAYVEVFTELRRERVG